MRSIVETFIRQVKWRTPAEKTKWDHFFRGKALVVAPTIRPSVHKKFLDDWLLQSISMCPKGGAVYVAPLGRTGVALRVQHLRYIESGEENIIHLLVDQQNKPYVYFDMVLFSADLHGFGAVAFYRAAQAAQRAGFDRIELLAAGGAGYKIRSQWSRSFNGFYSWARYGFDAPLHPETRIRLANIPQLAQASCLLDVLDIDPEWWRQNGAGSNLTFDLKSGSRSWYTLKNYLVSKGLKRS
ncbi:hypothetical protein [Burkholderia gladioli]|uniref:hypothetical protein n=1 Tax=Burkholderia gladioli TaxID=28095 RepID=UPI00163E23C4|nr:hypothetical protein [Burkholderia gladioli]